MSVFSIVSITRIKRSDKIEDIGHNLLPVFPCSLKQAPDIIVVSLMCICFYSCKANINPVLISFIVVTLLRFITTHLTVLPHVDSFECTNRHIMDCTQDYIFSGHMAYSVLSILYILSQIPSMTVIMILVGIVQGLLIIGLRNHYTVDVFLGTLISYFVYLQHKIVI
jgi:hypothetical protein